MKASTKNVSKEFVEKSSLSSLNSTDNELEEFVKVLADDENSFAVSLEKLALKKSANKKVLSQIKVAFDRASLKASWNKISDRAKNGSGLSPVREANWFYILNEKFAENNVELNLVSSAKDTSYLNSDSDREFDQEEDKSIDEISSAQLSDTQLQAAQSSNTTAIKKTIAAPLKKRKVVRSQQQELSHLAASVEQLASSAAKNQRLAIEADLKRDKMLIDFKRDKTQKNREHDI